MEIAELTYIGDIFEFQVNAFSKNTFTPQLINFVIKAYAIPTTNIEASGPS